MGASATLAPQKERKNCTFGLPHTESESRLGGVASRREQLGSNRREK
jgi:hypothetical protein